MINDIVDITDYKDTFSFFLKQHSFIAHDLLTLRVLFVS